MEDLPMFRLKVRAAGLTAGLLLAAGFLMAQGNKDKPTTEPPPSEKDLAALKVKYNQILNPADLQKQMAVDVDDVLRRTRISRLAFDFQTGAEGKHDLVLTVEGITLKGDRKPGEQPGVPKDLEAKIEKLFLNTHARNLMSQGLLTPEGKLKAKLRPFQETFTVLDDARHPARVLQQMSREPNVTTALNGALFADATFNADGQL